MQDLRHFNASPTVSLYLEFYVHVSTPRLERRTQRLPKVRKQARYPKLTTLSFRRPPQSVDRNPPFTESLPLTYIYLQDL